MVNRPNMLEAAKRHKTSLVFMVISVSLAVFLAFGGIAVAWGSSKAEIDTLGKTDIRLEKKMDDNHRSSDAKLDKLSENDKDIMYMLGQINGKLDK